MSEHDPGAITDEAARRRAAQEKQAAQLLARQQAAATGKAKARRPPAPRVGQTPVPTAPASTSPAPSAAAAALEVRAVPGAPVPDAEGTAAPFTGAQEAAHRTVRGLARQQTRRARWTPGGQLNIEAPGPVIDTVPGRNLGVNEDDEDVVDISTAEYLDPVTGELMSADVATASTFPTIDSLRERAAVARRAGGVATPFERWSADDPTLGAYNFSDLISACPLPEFDAAHRIDMYWDQLGDVTDSASWTNADRAKVHAEAGWKNVPRPLRMDKKEALKTFLGVEGWRTRLAMLGSLHSWRTASAEQLAAMTGDPRLGNALGRDIASTFGIGAIEIGTYRDGITAHALKSRRAILRPGKTSAYNRSILPNLTHAEWLAVTGCQDWSVSGLYDRHNLLATELGLRLAEYAPVGAVLGERFSKLNHLAGTGIGKPAIYGTTRSADLTVVRPDGMRIAIELVARVGPNFYDKVRRWARVMEEQPLETSGLCVVFVICGTPDTVGNAKIRGRSSVYGSLLSALRDHFGDEYNRVAERFGIATWREWFPAKHMVSDDFTSMRVDSPVHHLRQYAPGGENLGQEDIWMQLDFLDPQSRPFTCDPSFDALAVIDNSRLLGQTPIWMRDIQPVPDIWLDMFAPDGVEVPIPPPKRNPDGTGVLYMEGIGAVGPTQPPRRLLGLAEAHQLDRSLVRVNPHGIGSFSKPPQTTGGTGTAA